MERKRGDIKKEVVGENCELEVREGDGSGLDSLYLYEWFTGKQIGSHCALERRGIISDNENKENNK